MSNTNLTNIKFNRLTVIRRIPELRYGKELWECLCDCGEKTIGDKYSLINGTKKSCGCIVKNNGKKWGEKHKTHGMHGTRIYKIWAGMKNRINNPNIAYFHIYGGKGIKYDKGWEQFENFYKDMISGYSDGLSLDRIDSNGNYCKENCRWATDKQQSYNTVRNKIYKYQGCFISLEQAEIISGIKSKSLWTRIEKLGWSIDKAIDTPILKSRWDKRSLWAKNSNHS